MKRLPFIICAAICLCMPLLRADMHKPSTVETAMELWRDAKVRGKLQCVGVSGGFYRATDAGEQVLVEANLIFRDGSKIRYRKYHPKRLGFPTVIDLVKAHFKMRPQKRI